MADLQCAQCKQWKGIKDFRVTGTSGGAFEFSTVCLECEDPLDFDLFYMERTELIAEVKRLRAESRCVRTPTGHDLCWYSPELWGLLPEKVEPKPEVPPREEFLHHCALYRDSLGK